MRARMVLPLLVLSGASCNGGLPAGRTSVFLTVQNGPALSVPEELHVSAFGDGASLYTDQRVPASGTLVPMGATGELGTLTVYVPDGVAELRVTVAGYAAGVQRSQGTTTARPVAGHQITARVTLAAFTGGGDAGIDAGFDGGVNADSGGGDSRATDGATPDLGGDGPPPDLGSACQNSSLAGTSEMPATAIDLTAEGTQDWRFWGGTGASTFKRTAGDKISDYTLFGGGSITTRFRNSVTFSWSDGSPTMSQTAAADTMTVSGTVGGGASLMVPATSTAHTLSVYVGGANDTGTMEATLSDGCVPTYTATSSNGRNDYNVAYRFTFKSSVPGTVLRIRWTMSAGFEAIGLYAATLN